MTRLPLNTAALAAELVKRSDADQAARHAWIAAERDLGGPLPADHAARVAVHRVDADNTAWLQAFVAEHGWPTFTTFGRDAGRAAWLLCQHAGDLEFMTECLTLMSLLIDDDLNEVDPVDVAYLDDRVRMMRGEPQRYGTQSQSVDGGPETLWHLDGTRADVDARRAALGMGPIQAPPAGD